MLRVNVWPIITLSQMAKDKVTRDNTWILAPSGRVCDPWPPNNSKWYSKQSRSEVDQFPADTSFTLAALNYKYICEDIFK